MRPRTGRAVTLAATVVLAGATSAAPAIAADTPPEVTVWIPVSDTPITVTVSSGTVVPGGPRSPEQPPAPGPAPTGIEVEPPGSTTTAPQTAPPPTSPPAPTTAPGNPAPTTIEVSPPPPSTTSSTPPAPRSGTSTSTPPPPPSETAAPTGPTPGEPLSTPTAGPAPLTEPAASPSSTTAPTTGGPSPTQPATPTPPVVDRPAPTDPTAAPAPPAGTNRSGKPWESGVFAHKAEYAAAWEQTTAQPADVLTVFPTRGSWTSMMDSWWLETAPPGFTGTISVGVPLWPANGDLATAARGGYDAEWKDLAKLVASKYPDAYVRIGWEFNIPGWGWEATPENVEDWKAAWRAAAASMRSVAPGLRMDWNPNGGPGQTIKPASLAYPGDDVVDVVGVDAYDWDPPITSEESWQQHLTEDGGLQGWADFARARGKKLSFPEWGVVTHSGKNAGGDNPEYIKRMTGFFAANADIMAYEAYFEEPEGDYLDSSLAKNAPRAGAQYRVLAETIRAGGLTSLGRPAAPTVQPTALPAPDPSGKRPTAAPAPADRPAGETDWAPSTDGHGPVPTSTP